MTLTTTAPRSSLPLHGAGGAVKRAMDGALLGLTLFVDRGTHHNKWGTSLVAFGNHYLSKPAGSRPAERLIVSRFWNIRGDWEPKGGLCGCFTSTSFLYGTGSDTISFQNSMCSCSPCISRGFQACQNNVDGPKKCKFVGLPEELPYHSKSDSKSHSESDLDVGSAGDF